MISQDIVRVNPQTPSDSATNIVVSIQTANRKFHVKRDWFPSPYQRNDGEIVLSGNPEEMANTQDDTLALCH